MIWTLLQAAPGYPMLAEMGRDITLAAVLFWMVWWLSKRMDAQQAARDAAMDAHIKRLNEIMEAQSARLEKIADRYHEDVNRMTQALLKMELQHEQNKNT